MERGFINFSTLAILAGYKFQSKNMTAMGVQVFFLQFFSIYSSNLKLVIL